MPQFRCTKKDCSGRIDLGSTICPACGRYFGVFGKHKSDALLEKYREKRYQGQSPRDAKVVFIGRDANFAANLSGSIYIFSILLDYLDNGIKFWENSDDLKLWQHRSNTDLIRKVHHPFLLPAYGKKDGYAYHHNFSRLELNSPYAKCISFVEIVSVPTTGYPKNDPNDKLKSLTKDSKQHIERIESDILSGDKKVVFISDAAIRALGDFDRLSNFYRRMYDKKHVSPEGIPELDSIGNVTIRKCYHFSATHAKKKEHIKKLRGMIEEYCGIFAESGIRKQ